MNERKSMKERVRSFDLNKIKETADAVSKFIDIVVGIVMSVMLAIVGIQQNLSMEKQEEQFAALQSQLNEQAQIPSFRLAEDYDEDGFIGYTVINDGRLVTCLDIRLEKWLHIQTTGNPLSSFMVPYNMASAYIAVPAQRESVSFCMERTASASAQETIEEYDENGMPIENELPVRFNLMDVQPLIAELEVQMQADEEIGYRIDSMEILTLSFVDTEQKYEARRYFIAAQAQQSKDGNAMEHPLYLIDEQTWVQLLAQIPEGFERIPDSLNAGIYSHPAQFGFGWRRNDVRQSALAEDIMQHIDSLKRAE